MDDKKRDIEDLTIYLLIISNIFYAIPYVVASTKIVNYEILINLLFPALVLVVSMVLGFDKRLRLEFPVLLAVVAIPALILIPSILSFNIDLIYVFIYSAVYAALSFIGMLVGDRIKLLDEKGLKKSK